MLARPVVALLILADVTLATATAPNAFRNPPSTAVDAVDPLVGNGGDTPNGSGGMIPSVAPPFAMTRWVAQTQQNFVSATPYNVSDAARKIHGFQSTHQPAIWMGESAPVEIVPGIGNDVKDLWDNRGMVADWDREVVTPSYYAIQMDTEGGKVFGEASASKQIPSTLAASCN